MQITIDISCDNSAFGENNQERKEGIELARILNDLADKIQRGGVQNYSLRDVNGNIVGKLEIEDDDKISCSNCGTQYFEEDSTAEFSEYTFCSQECLEEYDEVNEEESEDE